MNRIDFLQRLSGSISLLMLSIGCVMAGPCPGLALPSTLVALGSAGCTLPDNATMSNFRFAVSTTGTPTTILQNSAVTGVAFSASTSGGLSEGLSEQFAFTSPVPVASSITINVAYTLAAPPGASYFTAGQGPKFVAAAVGDPTIVSATTAGSFCVGGIFLSFPPGACSGTLISSPLLNFSTGNIPNSTTLNLAPGTTSIDIFATATAGPDSDEVEISQGIAGSVASPPPPTPSTPAPPTLLLALAGLGISAAYYRRQNLRGQTPRH